MRQSLWAVSLLVLPALAMGSGNPIVSEDTVLHVKAVEEIRFRSAQFEVVGNLYLPVVGGPPCPLVIWVSGSGPGFRNIKNTETVKLVNRFLDNGFAYFMIDKPGSGDSKGELHNDSLFAQLSRIIVDAVKTLRSHPLIRPNDIGLFGSSQAGYLMPLAISKCNEIAFMIGSSCPGENSIDQWNYLLEQQMICSGLSRERAKKNVEMFSQLRCTADKEKFDEAIAYFDAHPFVLKMLGYDSSFSQRARSWWPRTIDVNDEMHFDPMTLVRKIHVPLYLVYGARDTQIDPLQGMSAYREACLTAGNSQVKMVMLPNSDHNMKLSGGCLDEIQTLSRQKEYRYDPEFLLTISCWLEELRNTRAESR